jgi:hypothetical protein
LKNRLGRSRRLVPDTNILFVQWAVGAIWPIDAPYWTSIQYRAHLRLARRYQRK